MTQIPNTLLQIPDLNKSGKSKRTFMSTVEKERIKWGWFESFCIGAHRREKSLQKKYYFISFDKFFDASNEVRKQMAQIC